MQPVRIPGTEAVIHEAQRAVEAIAERVQLGFELKVHVVAVEIESEPVDTGLGAAHEAEGKAA